MFVGHVTDVFPWLETYLIWRRRLLVRICPVTETSPVRLGFMQQGDIIRRWRLQTITHLLLKLPLFEMLSFAYTFNGTKRRRRIPLLRQTESVKRLIMCPMHCGRCFYSRRTNQTISTQRSQAGRKRRRAHPSLPQSEHQLSFQTPLRPLSPIV